MSATERRIPGPDHPITIEPHPGRVRVRAGGRLVADTTRALALREANHPAVFYVPIADLDRDLLSDSPTTTYCPYKGTAGYWSIATPDGELSDAVWYYAQPYDAVGEIAGHAAFYPDRVKIEERADPADSGG